MAAQNFGPCQLHIPHKEWAAELPDAPSMAVTHERENWSEIERWVNERFPGCTGGCYTGYGSGSVTPADGVGSVVTPAMTTVCGIRGQFAIEVIVAVRFPSSAVGYRHLELNLPNYSPAPVHPGMTVPGVARGGGQLLSTSGLVSTGLAYTFTVEQTSGGPQTVPWTVFEMGDCTCAIPTGC